MVCIVGIDFFCEKCVEIVLIYIYGIGLICFKEILVCMGVSFDICVKNLLEVE